MKTNELMVCELKRSTLRFEDYMNEYKERQPEYTQPDDRWNMAQLIEHVTLSDQAVLDTIRRPASRTKSSHYTKYKMRDMMINRRRKLKSKEELAPHDVTDQDINALLAGFRQIREEIINLVENGELDLQSTEAWPHSGLGLLTRRDWLYMICFHSDRHIAQTQEMFI